ncbi:MAG: hypothetical protein SPI86_05365, partial [Treponemataceae bacterium]|nr:hypothetical protein [Spirochaetales bacterium]MDY6031175.1 hypothetical protein [Treponemataceae bacterium]
YEPIKGIRFACRNKKEESYNRQQTDTLFKKRKMSALRIAESIMRLPCYYTRKRLFDTEYFDIV